MGMPFGLLERKVTSITKTHMHSFSITAFHPVCGEAAGKKKKKGKNLRKINHDSHLLRALQFW